MTIPLEPLALLAALLLRSLQGLEAVFESLERGEDVVPRGSGCLEVLSLVVPEVLNDTPHRLEELLIDLGHWLCSKAWSCSVLCSAFDSFDAQD